jgi:hypothetical protein
MMERAHATKEEEEEDKDGDVGGDDDVLADAFVARVAAKYRWHAATGPPSPPASPLRLSPAPLTPSSLRPPPTPRKPSAPSMPLPPASPPKARNTPVARRLDFSNIVVDRAAAAAAAADGFVYDRGRALAESGATETAGARLDRQLFFG